MTKSFVVPIKKLVVPGNKPYSIIVNSIGLCKYSKITYAKDINEAYQKSLEFAIDNFDNYSETFIVHKIHQAYFEVRLGKLTKEEKQKYYNICFQILEPILSIVVKEL